MANRRFNQFPLTLEHKVVMLDGYVNFSATGTVTEDRMLGATTARTGVGLYSTTLDDHFAEMLSASIMLISPSVQALFPQLVRFKNVTTESMTNVSVIDWKLVNKDGTAADVTLLSGVTISLRLRNSSVA